MRKRIRLWVNAGAIVESQDRGKGAAAQHTLLNMTASFPAVPLCLGCNFCGPLTRGELPLINLFSPPCAVVFASADAFPRGDGEDNAGCGGGGEEERESAVASAEEQEAAGMRVYQQYVIGMLTNFDSLPLERIHNMLKMFVSDPPYDKSLQQARERSCAAVRSPV